VTTRTAETTLAEARRRARLLDTRPWEARRIEDDEVRAAAEARELVDELERAEREVGCSEGMPA
jgi:hypothetical protein